MFGEDWSESPRLPSPWETAAASAASYSSDRTISPQPRCLIPEEDLSGHIEYKLRLPAYPSTDRLARLTSQLKWRLLEGGGEAMYEIGVCDNGLLLGIDRQEMDASLRTLEKMAEALGAVVRVIREVQVDSTSLAEDVKAAAFSRPSVEKEKPVVIARKDEAVVTTNGYIKKGMNPTKLFVHKQALSKKGKRTIRRDKLFRAGCSNRHTYSDELRQQEEQLDVQHDTELESSSWREEGTLPNDANDTPPLDEVPLLSHSPSPPRPTARQVQTTTTSSISSNNVSVSHSSTSSTTASSITTTEVDQSDSQAANTAKLLSPEALAEEEQRRTIRRHLQKQWKKDRQREKVAQRRLAERGPEPLYSATTPEDRYMDGLVGMFDGVDLEEVQEVGDAVSKKKKKWRYRQDVNPEKFGKIGDDNPAVMMSSTLDDTPSPTMIHDQQRRRMAFAVPLSLATAETRRYAMECIVSYPTEEDNEETEGDNGYSEGGIGQLEEDEQEGEDDEDTLFPSIPPPNKQRTRLRSNNAFRKPSYIDFENPELLMP